MKYATQGFKFSCGQEWTKTEIAVAVQRGPHPSAITTDRKEVLKNKPRKKLQMTNALSYHGKK